MAEASSLLPLFCWLSPSFPIGAYAYSHGLEWAAEAGDVHDEASLRAWLLGLLRDGFGRNDAILIGAAYRAVECGHVETLSDVNDLALALAPSGELRLETGQQGRSFIDAVAASWPIASLLALLPGFRDVALPVALGTAAACHRLPREPAVTLYLASVLQNLVSAALRLAPIGQTAGQRVLASLVPEAEAVAKETAGLGLDDLGSATFRADLGSLRHETQYTRLFRS